jgi:hypothetical protein
LRARCAVRADTSILQSIWYDRWSATDKFQFSVFFFAREIVYLGSGRTFQAFPAQFVVAYAISETGALTILNVDGSVVTQEAEKAAKVIAELKAGKNPPPSLD